MPLLFVGGMNGRQRNVAVIIGTITVGRLVKVISLVAHFVRI
jgi:hypothetical protein